MEPTSRESGSIGRDLWKGALAGAAATWLMGKVTTWAYKVESEDAKRRESAARGEMTAYERAAERAAGFAGLQLSGDQRSRAGTAIHWATGIAGGMGYALLRRRAPAVGAAKGLAFGTGFFLLVDELMNWGLGLTPGPAAFPWQAHARGFGGHLAFGLASDAVLSGLDRVA